jgi:hypothetical protein
MVKQSVLLGQALLSPLYITSVVSVKGAGLYGIDNSTYILHVEVGQVHDVLCRSF